MSVMQAPDAPYKLRRLNIIGLCIVLFGIVGSLSWAIFTPLDSAVVAMGKVKVHSERKQVQHLEGGIVKSLEIKEGDRIYAGQLLLTLDETFANSDLDRLKAQKFELQIRESLLIAQRDKLKKPIFSDSIHEATIDAWVADQLQSGMNSFYISQANLKSQVDILKNQSVQLKEQINGVVLEKEAKAEQLSYMEEEISAWKNLLEHKLTNKLRYLELQGGAAELKGEIAQLSSQAASLQEKMGEIELKKLRIMQDDREKAAKELSEVQLSLKDVSKRMDSAKNILGRVGIRSPVDGVIVGLQVHTLGAVIKPGDIILEIVPEKDELIIEAKIKPMDVDKVYKTLESRVRISSYKQHEFPEFMGVVESVSADVFEDPQTQESYYTARIIIPELSLAKLPRNKIQPGMPSEVLIKTGESTPFQYLMEPLVSAFRKAWRDQ